MKAVSNAIGIDNSKYLKEAGKANKILNVRMADLFAHAKHFMQIPCTEIEQLLASDYEARMGAVSIMDFQARDKRISPLIRKELYHLYISQHKQ